MIYLPSLYILSHDICLLLIVISSDLNLNFIMIHAVSWDVTSDEEY